MSEISPAVNVPVRSLQTYLRKISQMHREIPPVIPDGKYGVQTESSVRGFQQKYGLPPTGRADHDTWQRVIEIYRDVWEQTSAANPARVYPESGREIRPGEQDDCLYAIQGMMLPLTRRFSGLGSVGVTGINDAQCTECVRKMQVAFGQEPTGTIDKSFWNSLAGLYAAQVSQKRVLPEPVQSGE